jgi:hypothetical protein
MGEQVLPSGNTHAAIVRRGDTVRRPTGPWTPAVHDLLRHLERKNFDGSPRVLGIDGQDREVLTFIPGDVVYPDHSDLVMSDDALGAVSRLIRDYHDAVADFPHEGQEWSDRGSDAHSGGDLVCHNDLAPWNLVHKPDGRWVFIDWDLAAPGNRQWDLAWALLTLVPLMPEREIEASTVSHRLSVFRNRYGADDIHTDVIDVAVARCLREAGLIRTLGEQGVAPYDRLLAEGHREIWESAAKHVATNAERWKLVLTA